MGSPRCTGPHGTQNLPKLSEAEPVIASALAAPWLLLQGNSAWDGCWGWDGVLGLGWGSYTPRAQSQPEPGAVGAAGSRLSPTQTPHPRGTTTGTRTPVPPAAPLASAAHRGSGWNAGMGP